jgi:succinoglycan biosynthesis transport protein ExoP
MLPSSNVVSVGGLEGEDISFQQAFRVIRKRRYIILGLVVACGGLALLASCMLSPYYKAKALVEIEKQQGDPMASALGQLAGSLGGTDDTKTEIQTQVSVLQSDALAIETMHQTRFGDHVKHPWWEQLEAKLWRGPSEPAFREAAEREAMLTYFSDRLTVTPIPDTRLIEVTFEDTDPVYSAILTNALVNQYIRDRLGRRNLTTIQASEWMSNQIADLNKQVEAAQQRLIDYQRKSGLIVSPGATSNSAQPGTSASVSSPVLDRLTQLNKDLVSSRELRITREAIYVLAKSGDADALVNMAAGQSSAALGQNSQSGALNGLSALRQQEVTLKLQLSSALQSYGPKNPHLVDLDGQLLEIHRQIDQEIQGVIGGAGLDYQVALKAEGGIQQAYDREEQEAYKVNDSQIHLAVLQQEADSTRVLYEDLFTKLQESKLSVGTQSSNVAVISNALRPARAAHPKKGLNTGIGIGAGMFLGVVLAFVLDNCDDAIGSGTQVEELTGFPVLGLIPQFESTVRPSRRKSDHSVKGASVLRALIPAEPTSEAGEAYRVLRTAILLSQAGSPPRTILIASSVPKEGKSTTTYNLAVCFASLGIKVLALDADFRKPSLHRMSGTPNLNGLSNVLTSSLDPSQLIVSDAKVSNLHLLTAGPTPPNPAELLGSQAFETLLAGLVTRYDLVLIDSPPALLVADSVIISAKVDGTLVVLRSGKTTRPLLLRVTSILQRNRANILGYVLNAVDTGSPDFYYSYGYRSGEYYEEKANVSQTL